MPDSLSVARNSLKTTISRPAVGDNVFQIGVVLLDNRANSSVYEVPAIQTGSHDRNPSRDNHHQRFANLIVDPSRASRTMRALPWSGYASALECRNRDVG